jgi:hypothetical protein
MAFLYYFGMAAVLVPVFFGMTASRDGLQLRRIRYTRACGCDKLGSGDGGEWKFGLGGQSVAIQAKPGIRPRELCDGRANFSFTTEGNAVA